MAFDFELLEAAVDEQRDALLERLGVDDQLAVGRLLFLEDAEDLLEQRALLRALDGAVLEVGGVDLRRLGDRWRIGQLGVELCGISGIAVAGVRGGGVR